MSTSYITWKDKEKNRLYKAKVYSEINERKAKALINAFYDLWVEITNARAWNTRRQEMLDTLHVGAQVQVLGSEKTNTFQPGLAQLSAVSGDNAVLNFYIAGFEAVFAKYPNFVASAEVTSISVTNWTATVNAIYRIKTGESIIIITWVQSVFQLNPKDDTLKWVSSIETGHQQLPLV